MDALPLKLIDRYARPMIIKNTIKNAIDFFHMEAPSASVSMKLDPDLQTTVMADGLCRISGTRTSAKVWKTQRQAPHVCAGAEVRIAHSSSASVDKRTIHVCWRVVTPRSSRTSFGWMITTTDMVHLKPYLSCQLNVFGIEAGFRHKRPVTH